MSRSDRGTAFAVGLIVGTSIAVLFLVWAIPEFRDPSFAYREYQEWQVESFGNHYENQDNSHYWIRPFDGWLFSEDSLAQWLMAGLGAAATAISLFALIWLKRTWDQTKRNADAAWEAVEDTRRIGEAQVRAYMIIGELNVEVVEKRSNTVRISIALKNGGATPAINISRRIQISERFPKDSDANRILISSENDKHFITDIGPNETKIVYHREIQTLNFKSYVDHGNFDFQISCYVTYQPVIGDSVKSLTANYWVRSIFAWNRLRVTRVGRNEST